MQDGRGEVHFQPWRFYVYMYVYISVVCVCACVWSREQPGYFGCRGLAKWRRLTCWPTSGIPLPLPLSSGMGLISQGLSSCLNGKCFPEQPVFSAPEHTWAHVTGALRDLCEDELSIFLGCFKSRFLIKQPAYDKECSIICSGNEVGTTRQRLHLVFFHWCYRRSVEAAVWISFSLPVPRLSAFP